MLTMRLKSDLPVLFPYPRIYPGEYFASVARVIRPHVDGPLAEQYAYVGSCLKYVNS